MLMTGWPFWHQSTGDPGDLFFFQTCQPPMGSISCHSEIKTYRLRHIWSNKIKLSRMICVCLCSVIEPAKSNTLFTVNDLDRSEIERLVFAGARLPKYSIGLVGIKSTIRTSITMLAGVCVRFRRNERENLSSQTKQETKAVCAERNKLSKNNALV